MSHNLTLTLIIPVYNDERHLKACLNSVAAQTIRPNKVIVVDNNSTDKSVAIAKKFPFVSILQAKQQGVVFARDAGFNAVKTELIGRIDSDTVLPANWVEYILSFYRETGHLKEALTGSSYPYNIRLSKVVGWFLGQVAFRYNRLLLGHYILYGSNMVITKKQWLAVRRTVCNDTDVHEDLDLAIHLHQKGYKITYHEGLQVGVVMKRVRSKRAELWNNIMWWPKTLRRHGKKTWLFGWLAAVLFFAVSPLGSIAEYLARLFGRSPLED